MNSSRAVNSSYSGVANNVKERVRFAHLRASPDSFNLFAQSPDATIAFIDYDDAYFAAVAYCNPTDNFNKAMGRVKSTGRLVQVVLDTYPREGNWEYKYFRGSAEDGDFLSFKSSVIETVAKHNFYDILPRHAKVI